MIIGVPVSSGSIASYFERINKFFEEKENIILKKE
jgi:hypothetical protein